MESLRTLLCNIVDYAGLFPPAGLAMGPAVDSYAAYRAGEQCWMLGRFVVPVARLDEFEGAARAHLRAAATAWHLSALGNAGPGADAAADLDRVEEFNARHAMASAGGAAVIDAIELRAATPERVAAATHRLPSSIDAFV